MTLPTVFISHSRKDEIETNELLTHLSVLQRQGLIDVWSDDRIKPGSEWQEEIGEAITQARVAILLITANFLGSNFILDGEVRTVLQRRQNKDLIVFPIIARYCAWDQVDWLVNMEVRPKGGEPIWHNGGILADKGLATVVREVATIMKEQLEHLEKSGESTEESRQALYEIDMDLRKKGEIIDGKYEILGWLGSGGFAEVYLAQAEDARKVALKILKPVAVRNSNAVQRFMREATTITELHHPHIVDIIDTRHEAELLYIAMEYVSGGALRKWLDDGPVPIADAIHISKCIGEALIHAHNHENKIIHRDVKPDNILLDTNNESLRPVLSDFGLAKLLSADNTTRLTESGSVLGSYPYMAPEQWETKPLSVTTDLYALAIVFFEMLTGKSPFDGHSFMEWLLQHTTADRPLLSNLVPDVGTFFDKVVQQGMAINPANRHQSVGDFLQEIEQAYEDFNKDKRRRNELQKKIVQLLDLARSDLQEKDYEDALSMVERALKINPHHIGALRLKGYIYREQGELLDALDFFEQAYEQEKKPSSEVGIDYLEMLREVADFYWQDKNQQKGVEYYHLIVNVLDTDNSEDQHIQEIRGQVWPLLTEFHQNEGERANSEANRQNLDETIRILADHIQWLDRLNSNSRDLRAKQKFLETEQYKEMIRNEERMIEDIYAKSDIIYTQDDVLFQSYFRINEYYQALFELDPDDKWQEARHKKLREQAEDRCARAKQAEEQADFERAISHYRAIGEIEQEEYPGLAQNLNLDLEQRINKLERKADYSRKYKEIRQLILVDKELPKALKYLERDFIYKNEYEYRDVARMHWRLLYAKRHEWQVSPEWVIAQGEELIGGQEPEDNREQKPGKQLYGVELISIPFFVSALVIGVVIGILIGKIAPGAQSLPGLLTSVVFALLLFLCYRVYLERVNR